MPNRSRKKAEGFDSQAAKAAAASGNPSHREHHDIPRWRQIEIMRERAELREALGDIDFEDDNYEEEVFGSEEENESLYFHGDIPPEDEIELLDEDLDEDIDSGDFDDFDDD